MDEIKEKAHYISVTGIIRNKDGKYLICQRSLKEKMKTAFFIIFTAFFLTVAAMIPLFWAGAGMLKGFALTTIIGVSIGVLITRPAFSDIIKLILKD